MRVVHSRVNAINEGFLAKIPDTVHPENTIEISRGIIRDTILEMARMMQEDWVSP